MMELEKSADGTAMQKLQPFPRACFTASQSMVTDMLDLLVFVLVVCWVFWFVFFYLFVSLLPFGPILLAHPGVCPSLQSCYSIHAVSLC